MTKYESFYDPDYGLGTVAFYGSTITVTNTYFSGNCNSRGAALYIDGDNKFVTIQANLSNVTFESNIASISGGAFYFGPSFWGLIGAFTNLYCIDNQANKSHFLNKMNIINN